MSHPARLILALASLALISIPRSPAQVFSPRVQLKGQPDSTDLRRFADGLIAKANATTPREKAIAIWRYFLTDGRFVPPGFWYHLEGWAYEEPKGEVLDALQLLNSYGFGLCYHIAPLLEAVFEAAGFEDARVWFLTGHAAAEVYYEGAYHYFDSDLMGYTTTGSGDFRSAPVASVLQVSSDASIMLSKLQNSTTPKPGAVDQPWYPGDLEVGGLQDISDLFTSTQDNWLYRDTRYARHHTMDFVLRPGERLMRYFQPEAPTLFYLPFKLTPAGWSPFPTEHPEYSIFTRNGPRSLRDSRRWATGRIVYRPPLADRNAYLSLSNARLPSQGASAVTPSDAAAAATLVFEVQSPYVIIGAGFSVQLALPDDHSALRLETSTDLGVTWETLPAPPARFQGSWEAAPLVRAQSPEGALTSVSGKYAYLLRVTLTGAAALSGVTLDTAIHLNPRTLPELAPGANEISYTPGSRINRRSAPVRIDDLARFALASNNLRYLSESAQGILLPLDQSKPGSLVFELASPDGAPLTGFDAGGRFLDIQAGLAPDKLTAEPRATAFPQRAASAVPAASLEWAYSSNGPFVTLWQFDPAPPWRDGIPIPQALRWPEVDRQIRNLTSGTRRVYLRYSVANMALDEIRLATLSEAAGSPAALQITHVWTENGQQRQSVRRIDNPDQAQLYTVATQTGSSVVNSAIILEALAVPASYVISGNAGTAGATLILSGSQSASTTSDASGAYSFPNLAAGGSYSVTPGKAGFTFSPASAQFPALAGSQTANFSAVPAAYTIAGNTGLSGATVKLSGSQTAAATAGPGGAYLFANLAPGGTYTVTPSAPGFTFTPASRSFPSLATHQTADFVPLQDPVALSLDRTRLNFAVRGTALATPPQRLLLSFSRPASAPWSAVTNQPWVQVSPSSGNGPARLTVSIVPGSISATGATSAILTITAPGTANPALTVSVFLTRLAGSAAPFGTIDTPANGATQVSGSIAITGWALDDIHVEKVQIFRDPIGGEPVRANGLVYIADAIFVPNARPDVESAHPALPLSYRAGWGYLMLTTGIPNAAGPRGNGPIRLWAFATDIEGNTSNLGSKSITLDNASSRKPFGAIDTPAQGATISGADYVNYGWALTPLPNQFSMQPVNMWVSIDGVTAGRVNYGQHRPDIAAGFPGYRNSGTPATGGAGGFLIFDSTQYANGMHTIGWAVTDDAGNQEGIGSRFFFIENGVQAAAEPPPPAANALRTAKYRSRSDDLPRYVQAQELELLVIPLPEGEWSGAHVIDGVRRPLPAGSTLDNAAGTFYWQLGPGFLGRHELAFTNAAGAELGVSVLIQPKAYSGAP